MPYETAPRILHPSWESKGELVQRLPIKLSDGRIQPIGSKVITTAEIEDDESVEESSLGEHKVDQQVEDVSTGARFGRPAVVDIIGNKSRKARIQGAKEQIASICQEIVSEPENSVRAGHLSRYLTHCSCSLDF
jgi:nucleolar complex protein 3